MYIYDFLKYEHSTAKFRSISLSFRLDHAKVCFMQAGGATTIELCSDPVPDRALYVRLHAVLFT